LAQRPQKQQSVKALPEKIDFTKALARYLGEEGFLASNNETTTDSMNHCLFKPA
jgi:hypothetical protein